ncbi:uncharacterized protein RAG0_15836 [Rhynchosporium agropyri]|uniref:Uncharacterized protein n=1 Tax=Rhynchosporium agropyri TaxID=914238 RepID=A0A1E1LMQ8_9HELO|nr:uncharacterized protein RAG0_15836 [Rhynchosporium agropyri]
MSSTLPPVDGEEDYTTVVTSGPVVGLFSFSTSFEYSEVQTPAVTTKMDVDAPTFCFSLTKAPTANALYGMSLSNLDDAMDSVIKHDDNHFLPQVRDKQHAPKPQKLRVPDYKQQEDAFLHLANVVRFEKFANDTQAHCPGPITRGQMENLWHKTLRIHYDNWKDSNLSAGMRRKALAKANLQVEGYQGFDAKAYWGLQALTRVMDGISIGQEAEIKVKNGHFKAMEQARRKKKEQRRVKVDAEKNNQGEGKRETLRNTQDVEF